MSNDDEQIKEVYVHAGLALYLAQVFEHSVVNTLLVTELLPSHAGKLIFRKEWEKEFDIYLAEQFEKTLGRLVRALKKTAAVPEDLEKIIGCALEKRNFLAHHFFRERAEFLVLPSGRDEMIDELKEMQKAFEVADERLVTFTRPLRMKFGISDEIIRASEVAYLKNVRNL